MHKLGSMLWTRGKMCLWRDFVSRYFLRRTGTYAGENSTKGGVMSPIRTGEENQEGKNVNATCYLQLLNQFEAVDIAAPLLLSERGKTSVGNTHATGPKLTP
jgi:hypothetical protein